MRIMPLVAVPVVVLLTAATRPSDKPVCPTPESQKVDARDAVPRARKLGEMPPAKQMLTVLRSVDGCLKPVVVRDEVGAPSRPQDKR